MRRSIILVCLLLLSSVTALFAGGAGENGPVTISFWYPYGKGSWTGDFLDAKMKEFHKANPAITVEGQSYDSYGAIIEGLQRAAAAKTLPAVATIAYGYDNYVVDSGLAVPLNRYLAKKSDTELSDFFAPLLKVTTFKAGTYGVPLALSVAVAFYHPDLLEKAGLDPDSPPRTWAQFLAAAKTIHDKLGIYGATLALDDTWIFETIVDSNGGSLLGPDGKKAALDSMEAVQALDDWARGVREKYVLYNADFFETLQSFATQQVAMEGMSSYGTVYYRTNLPKVREMPWPAGEGMTIKSPAGGNSLYVFGNNEQERKAGAALVMSLTGTDANAEWARQSGYLPTRQSSLDGLSDFIKGFDNYKVAVSEIRNVVAPVQFPTRKDPQIRKLMMEAIESALLGKKSAQAALSEANAAVNDLLR